MCWCVVILHASAILFYIRDVVQKPRWSCMKFSSSTSCIHSFSLLLTVVSLLVTRPVEGYQLLISCFICKRSFEAFLFLTHSRRLSDTQNIRLCLIFVRCCSKLIWLFICFCFRQNQGCNKTHIKVDMMTINDIGLIEPQTWAHIELTCFVKIYLQYRFWVFDI